MGPVHLRQQLEQKGIADAAVLAAFERVPRQLFVPEPLWPLAYEDVPLPIGEGQTISQPYVVARTLEVLAIRPGDRVLDVGTGSGFQAALIAALGADTYSIEILPSLLALARRRLWKLGFRVQLRVGDGTFGWSSAAPFAAIAVAAVARAIPPALPAQLARPGRMVLPLGEARQRLVVLSQDAAGTLETRSLFAVQFVPLISPPSA
ncbi:MAG: protein-L-isoaspartate(D-aspartate) O-methyltransferase [Deltaproteobacteria bacterium]